MDWDVGFLAGWFVESFVTFLYILRGIVSLLDALAEQYPIAPLPRTLRINIGYAL